MEPIEKIVFNNQPVQHQSHSREWSWAMQITARYALTQLSPDATAQNRVSPRRSPMILTTYKLLGGVCIGSLALFFGWRSLSNHTSLRCPSFLSWLIERENPLFPSSHASAIVGYQTIAPKMRVLEVGCGPGRVTVPLAQALRAKGGDLVALDIQKAMLAKARKKVQAAHLTNVSYLQATLGAGKLSLEEPVDLILMVNVLGEIPKADRVTALKELFQVLAPGGTLSIYQRTDRRSSLSDGDYRKAVGQRGGILSGTGVRGVGLLHRALHESEVLDPCFCPISR